MSQIRKPLTRTEMISEISLITNADKSTIKNVITAYENIIMKDLLQNHETKIGPIGKIKIKERKERSGINPSTGEKVIIPAKVSPKFSFSKGLKECITNEIKIK